MYNMARAMNPLTTGGVHVVTILCGAADAARGRGARGGLAPGEVGSARRAVAVEHVDEGSVRSRGVERGDAGDEGVHVRAGNGGGGEAR